MHQGGHAAIAPEDSRSLEILATREPHFVGAEGVRLQESPVRTMPDRTSLPPGAKGERTQKGRPRGTPGLSRRLIVGLIDSAFNFDIHFLNFAFISLA